MTPLRKAVFEILAARDREVARTWSRQYRPSAENLSESGELADLSKYFIRRLASLPINTDRALQCLSGNQNNTNHWLMDFANVVSVIVVNYSPEIFGKGDSVDRSISVLGELVGA